MICGSESRSWAACSVHACSLVPCVPASQVDDNAFLAHVWDGSCYGSYRNLLVLRAVLFVPEARGLPQPKARRFRYVRDIGRT